MLRLLSLLFVLAITSQHVLASDPDTEALLALHQRAREAHLTGNADLLASGTADRFLEISRAKIHEQTREQLHKFFKDYLAQTKYSMWDDVVPPVIHLSPDRNMAWMSVHIHARATQKQEELDFESAWVATYEKNGGKWYMTSISSSLEEAPKSK